ncbi:nicotinate-nucleotide diphosphorylase (carboxylating) [PVC group bacterium (ex Bugula neritina AB1)]|nr:nicotinate-nucleotide diphosphorylase (carboxylating) [PVC group bacterium (ex Bugula neritina AB1)]
MSLNAETCGFIWDAYREDLRDGDVTTDLSIDKKAWVKADLVAKDDGVLSGQQVVTFLLSKVEGSITYKKYKEDGTSFKAGEILGSIEGPAWAILQAERTLLNFLQNLCGVASLTKEYLIAVSGYDVDILHTRKTMPLWRLLQSEAVAHGGGSAHRQGLYDQILIKENHLYAIMKSLEVSLPKAIEIAVQKCQKSPKLGQHVGLEVQNEEQAILAKGLGVHVILLDNMDVKKMISVVQNVLKSKNRPLIEASGGVTLKNVREIAMTGVDRISIGALTHSVPATDISLLIQDFFNR